MHIPPLKPGGEQRANVLAVRGDIHHVRVVFSTHLDTVPGSGDTQLTHAPGIISGRGAVDAKTQAALLMTVLTSIAAEHRAGTALLFVCGEETDHAGMSAAHGFALPDNITLVNLEPTEGKFVSVTKGMVRGVVRVRGKEMHSGYAHMGVSAINGLLDVLASMRAKWGVQGVDSMNVGVIKGGTAANVVAGYAEAVVLWRVGSSAEGVLGEIEALCAGEGVEFEVKTMNGPVEFFVPGIKGVRVGQVGFNTDVPYYRGLVARKVLWGVGSITVAHTEREYVHMEDIREGERILALLVPELLRSS